MSNGNGQNDNSHGGGAQDEYMYDVFLSYSYKPSVQNWVHARFYPKFDEWLDSALLDRGVDAPPAPGARVCLAKRELKPGDTWPDMLREQLWRSKVLVAICSPHYFSSSWCKAEWESFRQREGDPRKFRLRIPLLYDGSDNYLIPKINQIQYADFRNYIYTSPAMDNTVEGLEFEKALRKFAIDVAEVVADAPPLNGVMSSALLAVAPPPTPPPSAQFLSL